MDPGSCEVQLESSWNHSQDLHSVLSIHKSFPGSEEEFSDESPHNCPLSLTQPTPEEPCFLSTRVVRPAAGCRLSSVRLVSGARTVELYGGDGGYVGTVRGTPGTSEGDRDLFRCHKVLPIEENLTSISLKLLSLRGRQEVKVRELSLAVQVTQGQVKGQPQASHGGSAVASTGSLPPMMQSLVASLKLLSSFDSSNGIPSQGAKIPPGVPQGADIPRGVSQQGANIPSGVPDAMSLHVLGAKVGADTLSVTKASSAGVEQASHCSDDIRQLEQRLICHIDHKFTELQEFIERKFEDFEKRIKHTRGIDGD